MLTSSAIEYGSADSNQTLVTTDDCPNKPVVMSKKLSLTVIAVTSVRRNPLLVLQLK